MRVSSIHPSPENERIYRPVDPSDPEIIELAESIRKHGIKEPLVVTLDRFILSGHRRHMAAQVAGQKTVPVRWERIQREDNIDRFVTLQQLLRESIDSLLDTEAFNVELDAERADAAFLEGVRRQAHQSVSGVLCESNGET